MEKIKVDLNLSAEMIKSAGGVFEITMDGDLIHSKRNTGAFPEESDIINKIKKRL